ncbi:waprin-Rha1-like [Xenopus laevis]|uniref:WAP domain-containing protein n=2 Tax=Xenopus laevis TaxID=8355 RepID=A0A974BT64_XENLA|nr:waprin-Rha1-like [Xenopus laevis]OCT60534.1 hypothetical protein XELAEV_18046558mg [Xenopus laevis]
MEALKYLTLFLLLAVFAERMEAQVAGNTTSCPEVRDGILGICGRECTAETDCEQGWKCCPNACGKFSCMNPVREARGQRIKE